MRATIHQSYFIPWLGYFSKLAYSDVYVVLDNVHFRKRHFFDRTQIINMQGEVRWLSLPVGQNFQKKCNEVYVNPPDETYVNKMIMSIEQSYARARFFDFEWDDLRSALEQPLLKHKNLVEINLAITNNIIRLIGMKKPDIHLASNLIEEYENPTERLIRICKELDIDSVVVGGGKSLEVHDWQEIINQGVNIYIQNYLASHPVYEQSRRKLAGFQKGLAIIDAILNVGREQTLSFLVAEPYRPVLIKLEQ